MKKLLFLTVFTLLAGHASAQQGGTDYVVTTAGDTLRGQVRLTVGKDSQVKLFRRGQPAAEFSPADLRSYGNTRGVVAVSKQVGARGPFRLVTPLLVGYVSLYMGEAPQPTNYAGQQGGTRLNQKNQVFYLQAPDSAYVREVALASNQLTLAQVLVGCPELEFGSNAIQQRYPYTREGMTRLVQAYNTCRQPSQASIQPARAPGWSVSYGLKAGLNQSSFDFNAYDSEVNAQGTTGFQVGTSVIIATRTAFSLQLDLLYSRLRGEYGPYQPSSYNPNNNAVLSDRRIVRIRYEQLQLPIMLRYELGHGTWRPYLNAGGFFSKVVQNKSSQQYQRFINSPFVESRLVIGEGFLTGFAGGGGVLVRTASGPALTMELRLERQANDLNASNTSIYHRVLRLNAGILF